MLYWIVYSYSVKIHKNHLECHKDHVLYLITVELVYLNLYYTLYLKTFQIIKYVNKTIT